MSALKKEYKNQDVTIVWEPQKCIHSAKCVEGLPEVFKPQEKPWINMSKADSDKLVDQVKKCPSGALSYYYNNQENKKDIMSESENPKIEVINNGPLIFKGSCTIVHKDGTEEQKENRVALCRCGASSNKPFCDGSHKQIEFDTE